MSLLGKQAEAFLNWLLEWLSHTRPLDIMGHYFRENFNSKQASCYESVCT